MSNQSFDDERWQAESDANTLAESDVIKSDEGRMTSAKGAARRMAKEATIRAKSLQNIVEGTGMTAGQIKERFSKSYSTLYPNHNWN